MATADMQRAHALVTIKRADTEARRIVGIASTPVIDRMGDSLDPQGAVFNLPFPLLLHHDHTRPIGEVTDARVTPQGIYIVAQIAPAGTTDDVDAGWNMIRAGLLRGLSVGFIGREWQAIGDGGRRYTEWEVIETSAVAVPANPEAEIVEVKRLDKAQREPEAPAASVPSYPVHLTKAERQAVLEKAARDVIEATVMNTAKAMGWPEAKVRERVSGPEHLAKAEDMIRAKWQGERIEALEGRIAAMEARHG
ncbi:HK97 family phage prohead protease [Paenirhodobacter populi]|uniref:Prohead serine protease domain-containing protein n=1 Tax=Paenirhodobacter populi TaxID=2306993 RepID=A0A443IQE3_9RHOB|nr:HK97 family phage prohead protease [Sinirhodobacter populi]RWR08485.1 hypothetical protein D2T33_15430 [Sinirhodobacter populi]